MIPFTLRAGMPATHTTVPYLTADIPGIGGTFKTTAEDFRVEEIPLYPPSGEGTHVYARIEKTGISTFEACRRLCREIGYPERDIGTAGLKDARAVATQWVSFEHIDEAQLEGLALDRVRVLETARHGNKLRRGHLQGNAFTCILRDVAPDGEPRALKILDTLRARGVPNAFGDQRFGSLGTTHLLGAALVAGDPQAVVDRLLGDSDLEPDPRLREARRHYEDGDLSAALEAFPQSRNHERRALNLLRRGDGPLKVVKSLPKKLKALYVSALQSELFNRCLADRMPTVDVLRDGDIAVLHRNGAAFDVPDAAAEQARCETFEISPSGPLFGRKTKIPSGAPGALEFSVLDEAGLSLEAFAALKGGLSPIGARRPYRYPLSDVSLAYGEDGTATLRFSLPRGCYATNLLAEVCKTVEAPQVPETDPT